MIKYSIFIVGIFLVGCVHAPKKKATGLTAAQFWAEQNNRGNELKIVSGKLGIHFETKKDNVTGAGRLLTAGPSTLRLELRDPLGKLQMLVTLFQGLATVYYPTEKSAYVDGKGGTAYLRQFLGAEYSFDELRDLMLGILPRTMRPEAAGKKDFDRFEWDGNQGQYVGSLKLRDRTLTVGIDGETGVLRKLQTENAEVTFANFSGVKNTGRSEERVLYAETVDIRQKNTGSVIEVDWKEISRLKQSPASDVFRETLPETVRRHRLN